MANLLGGWDKIRRWIDNEPEDALPANIEKAHERKSESELFLLKLLNAIEAVLKSEIVRIPNTNRAYAPDKFVVYLSEETERNLRRDKREFFEQNLSALVYERAKELAGKLQLTAKKIAVEIAVDATLGEELEVRAVSKNEFETTQTAAAADDNKVGTTKTVVAAADENKFETTKNAVVENKFETTKTAIVEPESQSRAVDGATIDDRGTVEDAHARLGILYRVEIWQAGRRINEYPIIQRTNTVGRDDREAAANLRLPSANRKISRLHAEITLEETGEIWVESLHKNPTVVAGQTIRNGERARLGADGEIIIYDFTLKIKL